MALDLSGKAGWPVGRPDVDGTALVHGSAWCGWYGPGARLGPVWLVRPWCTARPLPPVGKLWFLGTASSWPTVVCVVHGSPLWLMALPFLYQVGS